MPLRAVDFETEKGDMAVDLRKLIVIDLYSGYVQIDFVRATLKSLKIDRRGSTGVARNGRWSFKPL
jgi:hypothetical protein